MYKILKKVVLPLLLLVPMTGQVYAAETGGVVETFSCNYNSGKGANDLDGAVGFWQSQIKKLNSADLNKYFGSVVTPIKGGSGADWFWLGGSPDLNTYTRGQNDYNTSSEGQAADARFAKVATCTSNMFFSEQIYAGAPPVEGDTNAIIQSYGCTLKKGKSMANVLVAEQMIIARSEKLNAKTNIYRLTPYMANVPADIVYLIGHDDLVSFGSSSTEFMTAPGYRSFLGAINSVMDCNSALSAMEVTHAPMQ
jgi:hypothetical protein